MRLDLVNSLLSVTRILVLVIAIALVSCTSHRDLTHLDAFQRQVGVELRTERLTYIYDFPYSAQSLWNHTYKYGIAGENGEMTMHESEPKAECPPGSIVWLDEVRFTRKFDNPEVIEALGRIYCSGQVWQFRYVWGLGPKIHDAPWESETYDPRNTRKVL